MTRIERLENELDRLYGQRAAAARQNNLHWMEMAQKKISELEKELIEARQYAPRKLSEFLSDKGEDTRNRVFKALLKISLAADFLNDCAEEAKDVLGELGLKEHTLTGDVESVCALSQKLASFVINLGARSLTEMMTDNSDFICKCSEAADEHLKETLKL